MLKKLMTPANRVLIILLVLSLLMTFVPVAFLILFGMAPTLITSIIDNRRERYRTICIGSLNLVGVLPAALNVLEQDHSFERALLVLADATTWFYILTATVIGIGIAFVGPAIVATFYVARLEKRNNQLKRHQKKLVDEWGEDVARKLN